MSMTNINNQKKLKDECRNVQIPDLVNAIEHLCWLIGERKSASIGYLYKLDNNDIPETKRIIADGLRNL